MEKEGNDTQPVDWQTTGFLSSFSKEGDGEWATLGEDPKWTLAWKIGPA